MLPGQQARAAITYLSNPPPTADVVIIGGGVIGAATAFHASRAGLRPVVLERRPAPCSLTTAAAAGGFRLQLDDEADVPLVRETIELCLNFEELTGQRAYDPRIRPQGYLWVTTREEGAQRQRRLVAAQRSWGVGDVELLGGDDVRRAFPYLGEEVVQARFRGGDGLLDPKALTMGLFAGSGAPVATDCEAVGFRISNDRLVAVETASGAVGTRTAVIAAGPFSGELGAMAGADLPVTAVRRHKLVMPDVPEVPQGAPMTIDEDTGAHWRPLFGGASLHYTDPTTPPTPPSDCVPTDVRFAFQVLDPRSPMSVARVTPFWRKVWERADAHWMLQAGQYTMTPDRRPLLGPLPVEGIHVNTGYSGRGVMAGPAGSRHLIDVIVGKIPAQDNPFRPNRAFEDRAHLDPL
jgi:sarcosine oxidase, subunit beta